VIRMIETKTKTFARSQPRFRRADPPEPTAATVPAKGPAAAPQEKYAPKSDAPFQSVARLLIGGIHFAVLVGIVALLVTYGMAALRSGVGRAVASVHAKNMERVGAPSEGQFRAARPFSQGDWVSTGEVLGVIETPETSEKLKAQRRNLKSIHRAMLMAGEAARMSSTEAHQHDLRQLQLDAGRVESEIERLATLEEELVIRSPIDGRIWFGLAGSKKVSRHDVVAEIWPTGGELKIEIEAPTEQINEFLRNGTVDCRFLTPIGEVVVACRPISTTRQMVLAENGENQGEKEILAKIECIPDANATRSIEPGWLGTL
jgi:biotin carboxyl carrier protein